MSERDMPTDSEMLDWLEQEANGREGLLLHDGTKPTGRHGLGLLGTRRTLRQAISQAMGYRTPAALADAKG